MSSGLLPLDLAGLRGSVRGAKVPHNIVRDGQVMGLRRALPAAGTAGAVFGPTPPLPWLSRLSDLRRSCSIILMGSRSGLRAGGRGACSMIVLIHHGSSASFRCLAHASWLGHTGTRWRGKKGKGKEGDRGAGLSLYGSRCPSGYGRMPQAREEKRLQRAPSPRFVGRHVTVPTLVGMDEPVVVRMLHLFLSYVLRLFLVNILYAAPPPRRDRPVMAL